jgi:NADH-quinone oxidoreductase subunit M
MLWLYQRTMFGKLDNPANQHLTDMNWREWATLVPLIVMAFWIGLYPAPFFRALDKPVNKLVAIVQNASSPAKAAQTPPAPAQEREVR